MYKYPQEITAVVLGYDAVSPLGVDLDDQWDRAENGESGVGPLTRFPIDDDFPVRIAGQVEDFDPAPYPFLKPRAMAHWTSPIFKYAMLTVHRALLNSGLEITPELAPRTAVTFSSAVGGLDAVLNADRRMIAENKLPHPFANPNSCINMVGGKVAILTGAQGPIFSPITACATGLTSMIMGAMLINEKRADIVICGAVDFALVEPIAAGFYTMNGAYSPKPGQPEEPPERASRPFSINRRGFVLSEGSGCVILASWDFVRTHGLSHDFEVVGWSMTSDAHHFVAPNLKTVTHCIADCLEDAGLEPGEVDVVNAHAASTRVGDKVEYDALKNIFVDAIPPITANKSLIGHAMGASSVIETIFAMEGMLHGVLLPTINYTPDPAMPLEQLPVVARPLEQEFMLKNAFGFGGCNSCLVLKRVDY